MADVSITPANVQMTSNSLTEEVVLGEALSAGDCVYIASDGRAYGADNATAAASKARGLLATGGATGVKAILVRGELDVGASLTANTVYVVSANSKKLAPTSDLASTNWVTIVGIAKTTSLLRVDARSQGFQAA